MLPIENSLLEGILIFFFLILAYFVIVLILNKKGILKRYNISFFGPALMWRTKRGKGFLKKISYKKRFWTVFGNGSIVFCFITMVVMLLILTWQSWFVLSLTPEQQAEIPGPEIAFVIPGINPILPLEYIGYIILALIVAILVHEFSHGILTFVSKLKVKSLGLLYLVIPIGAFVEPDEEALKNTKTQNRMRIFAVGPTTNFVVVLICIILFSFVFMSSVQPAAKGLYVFSVIENSPAEFIGVKTGAIITSLNGTTFSTIQDFKERVLKFRYAVDQISDNQTVNISYVYRGIQFNKNITFANKLTFTGNSSDAGKGHPGIYSFVNNEAHLNKLKNPLEGFPVNFLTDLSTNNFLYLFSLPLMGYFQGYNPIVSPFTDTYTINGIMGLIPPEIFWIMVNALYWMFWLNFAIALFNVLPMIPLDGGYLFKDAVDLFVNKIRKGLSKEQREKIVSNISLIVSFLILLLIIFPWLVKYF